VLLTAIKVVLAEYLSVIVVIAQVDDILVPDRFPVDFGSAYLTAIIK
jgi:hypothetical protein